MGSFSIRSRSSLSLATGRRSVGDALRRPRPPRDGSVVPRALPCPDCMRALKRDSRNSDAASSSALSSELVPRGCAHLFLSLPISWLEFQASLELPWCPSTCRSRCVRDTGRGGDDVAAPAKPPLCCFACTSVSRVRVCLPDPVTCRGRAGQAGGLCIEYICSIGVGIMRASDFSQFLSKIFFGTFRADAFLKTQKRKHRGGETDNSLGLGLGFRVYRRGETDNSLDAALEVGLGSLHFLPQLSHTTLARAEALAIRYLHVLHSSDLALELPQSHHRDGRLHMVCTWFAYGLGFGVWGLGFGRMHMV